MKMTMHIDEALLARVIQSYGCASKTEAVDKALRELDRRAILSELVDKGIGASSEELTASVFPEYDIHALRAAEARPSYGKSLKRSRNR
jgi:hypothetical protein